MRNILFNYPQPKEPRYLENNFRNFKDTLVASYRDREFYHGTKSTGYGGYKYDGRWKGVAKNCCEMYNLNNFSKILQINCDFGFLLNDLKELNNTFIVKGTESSNYAIKNSMASMNGAIKYRRPIDIDFPENYFDLVIAFGVVYTLTIPDAILLLKNISRISKNNKSFITLATYDIITEKELFESWTLGGNLCLKREDWKMIMQESDYKGDFLFIDSNYLNLKKSK